MTRHLPAVAAALAAGALGGCAGDEDRPAPPPPPRPAAATAIPAPPPGEPVRFRSGDGRRVRGVLQDAGRGAPAVVLLHQFRSDLTMWNELAPVLRRAGYTTLAYDDRGDPDETELVGDLAAAVRVLRRRHGVRRVGAVGSSIGASTAVYAAATSLAGELDAVVALSAGDAPAFVDLQVAGRYRPRNLLLVSDRREAVMAENLAEGARGSRVLVSEERGHGEVLLADPKVRRALMSWLARHLRQRAGGPGGAPVAPPGRAQR